MSRPVLFEAPDISEYQGDVNFKQIRDAGYKQVYLRAGFGKNNIDKMYDKHAAACYNLGIPVMIYWFSYALNASMAAKEAEYAISHAKKYWSKCPIAFDLEYDTRRWAATQGVNIDRALATDMAIAFLEVVVAAGYIPVLYFNNDYRKNYFDLDKIHKAIPTVRHWYARYGSASDAELVDIDVWQYTSKGSIVGVSGNVDINKVFDDVFGCIPAPNAAVNNTVNLFIKDFQKAANLDGYVDNNGRKLDEDGLDGACTQAVRKKIELKAKFNIWTGSRGEVVKWWQQRLNDILDIDMEVNGEYNWETRQATLVFQRKFNLDADGIAGYNTVQMAFYN